MNKKTLEKVAIASLTVLIAIPNLTACDTQPVVEETVELDILDRIDKEVSAEIDKIMDYHIKEEIEYVGKRQVEIEDADKEIPIEILLKDFNYEKAKKILGKMYIDGSIDEKKYLEINSIIRDETNPKYLMSKLINEVNNSNLQIESIDDYLADEFNEIQIARIKEELKNLEKITTFQTSGKITGKSDNNNDGNNNNNINDNSGNNSISGNNKRNNTSNGSNNIIIDAKDVPEEDRELVINNNNIWKNEVIDTDPFEYENFNIKENKKLIDLALTFVKENENGGINGYYNTLGTNDYVEIDGFIVPSQSNRDYMNNNTRKTKIVIYQAEIEVFKRNNPDCKFLDYLTPRNSYSKGTFCYNISEITGEIYCRPLWIERDPYKYTVNCFGETMYPCLYQSINVLSKYCGGTTLAFKRWDNKDYVSNQYIKSGIVKDRIWQDSINNYNKVLKDENSGINASELYWRLVDIEYEGLLKEMNGEK